jgi:hypothetical protein
MSSEEARAAEEIIVRLMMQVNSVGFWPLSRIRKYVGTEIDRHIEDETLLTEQHRRQEHRRQQWEWAAKEAARQQCC